MHVTLVRIVVPLLAKAAAPSSMWSAIYKDLFQVVITVFFGLLFALGLKHVWLDAVTTKKENNERDLTFKELKDLESEVVRKTTYAGDLWCQHATEQTTANGRKPWKYNLNPHDGVAENMSWERLVRQIELRK